MSPTVSALAWTTEEIRVAGSSVRLRTAGRGGPLLVLHHDIGTPEQLPFYEALAQRFTVLLPSHPGYDGSERPAWMRSVRDVAVTYQALLAARGLTDVSVVAAPYGQEGRPLGTIGVIGPARMNYSRVIPLVDFTAEMIGEALGKS